VKYIDEFRHKGLIQKLLKKIRAVVPSRDINIMEVCGTHTQSFLRFGLGQLLPGEIKLVSGPGCPVCVSAPSYIDQAIQLARMKGVIILTFGDMLRLPGSHYSLEEEKAKGADVRVIYSAWDSLAIARENPQKTAIFLAVGFETTAPTIALSIIAAKKENLKNLFFLSSLKLMPPVLEYLVKDKKLNIQGFLCPGHVSVIIGTRPYFFLARKHKKACCVAGFEPLDILEGVLLILEQIASNKPRVDNQYARVVKEQGNPRARRLILQVFKTEDADWRGLGRISGSGLGIRKEFSILDAGARFSLISPAVRISQKKTPCRCKDILKGLIYPLGCALFSKACRPEHPLGPCMVSREGACNAYYRYH